ncbi:hypothetical protein PMIN05_005138 [Paraphaeosphaeria minitans]
MRADALAFAYVTLKTTPQKTPAGEEVRSKERGNGERYHAVEGSRVSDIDECKQTSDYGCGRDCVQWNPGTPVNLDANVRSEYTGAPIHTLSMKRHPGSPWSREKAQKIRDDDDMMPVVALKAMTTRTEDMTAAPDTEPNACRKIDMIGYIGFSARARSISEMQ